LCLGVTRAQQNTINCLTWKVLNIISGEINPFTGAVEKGPNQKASQQAVSASPLLFKLENIRALSSRETRQRKKR